MFFSLKEILGQWLGQGKKVPRDLPPVVAVEAVPPVPAVVEVTAPVEITPAAKRPGPVDRHGIRQLRNEDNLYALFTGEVVAAEEEQESFAELLPGALAGGAGLAAMLVAKHGLPPREEEKTLGRQARLARYPRPQVELDLHGLSVEEAAVRIESFLQTAQAKGLKTLRLITGKGLHSQGRPVLPGITERQLLALQTRQVVLAYRWEGDGREPSGSVVVYLRN